jgi:anti-sigma factor RsiW
MADYASGELSPEARTAFDHHLGLCINCVRYLESYTSTIQLGRRAFEEPDATLPRSVPDALVKAILAARR